MTIDEAIKHWEDISNGIGENDKACGKGPKQLVEWLKEYKIFKEKATPGKPNFEGDGIDNNGNIIFDTWICPNCEREYEIDYEEYDYCPFCGKAILWEYPEEED